MLYYYICKPFNYFLETAAHEKRESDVDIHLKIFGEVYKPLETNFCSKISEKIIKYVNTKLASNENKKNQSKQISFYDNAEFPVNATFMRLLIERACSS